MVIVAIALIVITIHEILGENKFNAVFFTLYFFSALVTALLSITTVTDYLYGPPFYTPMKIWFLSGIIFFSSEVFRREFKIPWP